jgi:PTS system ascorbate-specific IIA component
MNTASTSTADGCIPGTHIFIVAHAPLAAAFRQCVLHVYEEDRSSAKPRYCAGIAALDVQPDWPPEETLAQARRLLAQLQGGNPDQPTLILTDIFGATPCNVALKLAATSRAARLVAGINLPMLLRSVCYRHEALDALVARALAGGGQGVMQVAVAAPQNQIRKTETDDQIHHKNQQ